MNFLRLFLIVGPLPVTLLNGTTADATQVMADLNWIINQVNANAAPLATTALTNANNNFTTVQSGQPATQPANFPIASQVQNQAFNTLSSVLGTNTITARVSSLPLSAYATGQVFTFLPSNANTGAATVNIDGVGARSILNMGSGLSGAELQTYRPAVIAYDPNFNAFDLLNGTPYVQGPNIPSAATLNLDGSFGDYNQVDGTANITALTLSRGRQKLLEFTSSPLLSNSATLIMGSNITPNPGDVFAFRGEAGAVRLVNTFRQGVASKRATRTVLLSGSGMYAPPAGCTFYDTEIGGAGGGGGASNTNSGTAGGNTTFGPLTANGGGQGVQGDGGATAGAGGTASGGDVNITGGTGGKGLAAAAAGGHGGVSFFGGNAFGQNGNAGVAAAANSCSGGSGGSSGANAGGGGGAGGYARKVFSPAVSQPYSVGAKGTGAAAGTTAGGDGAAGIIIITEYYS